MPQKSTQYFTEFEKMMLEFIAKKNITQYSDAKSSEVFQNINKGIDAKFNYEHKKQQADAENSLRDCVLNA